FLKMEIIQEWTKEILIAVLTAVLIYIFKRFIHPFVLGVLQRTPDIEGIWNGFDILENGQEQQRSRMEIKQLGTNITVTVTVTRQTSDARERVFNYRGTISSGQVVLIWKEKKSN